MEFREVIRWRADDMPETTEAVVIISDCGTVIKRMPYKRWNEKNQSYSMMREKIYKQSTNRGKQRLETEDKKEKFGSYRHVEIAGTVYSVHRLVAEAFLEKKDGCDCVNHINGIRDDNRKDNLEWVSNLENVRHAWDTGLRDIKRMRKLPFEEMAEVIKMREDGISYENIGKKYGMRGESIRHRVKQYENGLRM